MKEQYGDWKLDNQTIHVFDIEQFKSDNHYDTHTQSKNGAQKCFMLG